MVMEIDVSGHRDEAHGEALPAGRYWIGDLCYVMHDCWDEVCDLLFEGRNDHGCNQGTFQLKDGRRFAIYNTQYGDGEYPDNNGWKYCVDSGSIGCILLSDIAEEERDSIQFGHIHNFPNAVRNGRTGDGDIWFDDKNRTRVCVHTGGTEDEDYYDEDEE